MTNDIVIVSRHPAGIQFVQDHLASLGLENAPVIAQATAADIRGKVVYGNVPMHLAAEAALVCAIEFDTPPRGAEYTMADMVAAGARIRAYTVRAHGVQACDTLVSLTNKIVNALNDADLWYDHDSSVGEANPAHVAAPIIRKALGEAL